MKQVKKTKINKSEIVNIQINLPDIKSETEKQMKEVAAHIREASRTAEKYGFVDTARFCLNLAEQLEGPVVIPAMFADRGEGVERT
jgi:hypothetical protein